MNHRRLRIAWSVFWGVLAVLLVMLWVRSYYQSDWAYAFRANDWYHLRSLNGEVVLQTIWQPNSMRKWGVVSAPASEFSGSRYGWNSQMIRPQYEFWGFAVFNSPKVKAYAIPHWLFVLLAATLAVLPWLKVEKRFSLRTMLIANTFVALALGLIMWASR